MLARGSGFGMGVGTFSRPLRRVGVLAMLDGGLDTTQHNASVSEVPPGGSELVPGIVVGVLNDIRCVVDGVEVTHCVISVT